MVTLYIKDERGEDSPYQCLSQRQSLRRVQNVECSNNKSNNKQHPESPLTALSLSLVKILWSNESTFKWFLIMKEVVPYAINRKRTTLIINAERSYGFT